MPITFLFVEQWDKKRERGDKDRQRPLTMTFWRKALISRIWDWHKWLRGFRLFSSKCSFDLQLAATFRSIHAWEGIRRWDSRLCLLSHFQTPEKSVQEVSWWHYVSWFKDRAQSRIKITTWIKSSFVQIYSACAHVCRANPYSQPLFELWKVSILK